MQIKIYYNRISKVLNEVIHYEVKLFLFINSDFEND
jgi:hypothetical protein